MRKAPDTGDLVLRPLLLLGDRGVDNGVERVIDGLHGAPVVGIMSSAPYTEDTAL